MEDNLMPFTLAHPAVILPIARGRMVASALVAGSMAPDLTYYVSLPVIDPSHTLLTRTHHTSSLLWLDPLIGLALLAVFQLLLKRPLVALLPETAGERVWPFAERFVWRRAEAVGWIVLSVAIGAATHVGWDRLGEVFGDSGSPKVDLAGTVVGLAAILVWTWRWWWATTPQPIPTDLMLPARLRTATLCLLSAVPVVMGAFGAVKSVQQLRADNLEDRSALPPEMVVPQRGWMDMADLALRTFAQEAVLGVIVVLVVYTVGWQLSRLGAGRRAPKEVHPIPAK
jgi:hypothetical protein